MNIKRIIREELEDGYKDSNEEDWEWVNNINPGESFTMDSLVTLLDEYDIIYVDGLDNENYKLTKGKEGWFDKYKYMRMTGEYVRHTSTSTVSMGSYVKRFNGTPPYKFEVIDLIPR